MERKYFTNEMTENAEDNETDISSESDIDDTEGMVQVKLLAS